MPVLRGMKTKRLGWKFQSKSARYKKNIGFEF